MRRQDTPISALSLIKKKRQSLQLVLEFTSAGFKKTTKKKLSNGTPVKFANILVANKGTVFKVDEYWCSLNTNGLQNPSL